MQTQLMYKHIKSKQMIAIGMQPEFMICLLWLPYHQVKIYGNEWHALSTLMVYLTLQMHTWPHVYDNFDSNICVNIKYTRDDTIAIFTIIISIITYLITYQKQLYVALICRRTSYIQIVITSDHVFSTYKERARDLQCKLIRNSNQSDSYK